jgi:hypothetical protein
MNAPKYFVICLSGKDADFVGAYDCLGDARATAERLAMNRAGTRFMIAVETQSVVGATQVNWSDK